MKSPWQPCSCKDCSELARIPKSGGKSFCDECTACGCPESDECQHKDIALDEDMRSYTTPADDA